jgi:hypothetical protein
MLTPTLVFLIVLNAITTTIRNLFQISYYWNKLGLEVPSQEELKQRWEKVQTNVKTYFGKEKSETATHTEATNGKATVADISVN